MSSDKHCCVPGCKDSGGMHKNLHGFPNPDKDRERFNTWLYAVGDNILGLERNLIYKYRRVCHSHFEEKYHCRNGRISNIAVPTLNIPAPFTKTSFADRKQLGEVLNTRKPSTSSDPSSSQLSGKVSSLVLEKKYTEKENIAPGVNMEPESGIGILPSDPSTINKGPVTKKDTMQPSNIVVANIDIQQKQESTRKTVKKKLRHLQMTHLEKELQGKLTAAKIKLSKCRNQLKKQSIQIKVAKKISTNTKFVRILEDSTRTAKLLILLQMRENKKKEKGRRFTTEEKIASLSILKQSPKAYRNLRKIFVLPAPQTLYKLIQKCNLHPGINKNIFSQLKKKAASMTAEEKICVILFDEVSLQANVTYDERKDHVTGFVDNGEQRFLQFADHAQVFMVRGLIKNYKQPVSYTFSASATKGPELAKQIKNVISEVQKAGLNVVASVCDQGSNNRQAIKILLNETRGTYLREGKEPKEKTILINNNEIVPLYDPPHLLKGIRNNLLTKNLKYEMKGVTKIAKWAHLHKLYEENPGYKGIRLIPKLTENHVYSQKINKMKVKYACQIFSRTIASNMGYLADKGILPIECKDTADLLLLMDNIFDSVNGSYQKNKNAKPLLGPVKPKSMHYRTWEEGIKILKSMKFVNAFGKEESVPSVQNWIWTLEGIIVLLKNLEINFNITSVWLRHLNQDPLENFFGAARSHGCRNNNPTCNQFQTAFTTLLINGINSVHTRGKNCEEDFCTALQALVIEDNTSASSTCDSFDFEKIFQFNFTSIEEKKNDPRKIAPLQYMSGYFVKKMKTLIFKDCEDCKADFFDDNLIEYIRYREYAGRRWLITPSENMIKLISEMQDLINEIVSKNLEKNDLKVTIKTSMFMLLNFNFVKCNVHKVKLIDYLINIVIRCFLMNYCKNINNILAGRRQIDDDEDLFQIQAKKYNNRCCKRKK